MESYSLLNGKNVTDNILPTLWGRSAACKKLNDGYGSFIDRIKGNASERNTEIVLESWK